MLTRQFGVPPPSFWFGRTKIKKWPPMQIEVIVYLKIVCYRLDLINLDSSRAPYEFSVILSSFGRFYDPTKMTDLTTLYCCR